MLGGCCNNSAALASSASATLPFKCAPVLLHQETCRRSQTWSCSDVRHTKCWSPAHCQQGRAHRGESWLAHADPLVERFEHWCRANLSLGFDLSAAASSVHASERTLSRRIKDVTGKAPLGFFQDIRVQRAVHLLETTADDIEKIAAAVGYADGVSLRALLRDKLGKGTREIRARVRNKGGEHHDR